MRFPRTGGICNQLSLHIVRTCMPCVCPTTPTVLPIIPSTHIHTYTHAQAHVEHSDKSRKQRASEARQHLELLFNAAASTEMQAHTHERVCVGVRYPPLYLTVCVCLCVFLHAWVRLLAAAGRRLPFILNSQRGKIAKRKNAKERTKRWRKKRWKSNKHFVAAATPKISARRGCASLSPSSQKCFAMQFE